MCQFGGFPEEYYQKIVLRVTQSFHFNIYYIGNSDMRKKTLL